MTIKPPFLGITIAGWLLLAGCERAPGPPARPVVVAAPDVASQPIEPTSTWPLEVVDGLGRKVVVARPALRIVSLAPSNTEILFAVGAGDRVVGRTTVCTYPSAAAAVASIGGMTPKGINLEAIVALRPDLVLAVSGVQEPIIAPLERLGLPVLAIDAEDLAGVARNLRLVGKLTDHDAESDQLATRFSTRIEAVRQRVAARTAARPRVLFLVNEDPPMTAGPKTFIGQMIETAGGINVFGDLTTRYPKPSEEEILARAPEVLLIAMGAMNPGARDEVARRARVRSRAAWAQIPAVRDNRITFLEADQMLRPGPRLADGLEALAAALDPR